MSRIRPPTAGELRHRLELQKNVGTTQDDRGHIVDNWVTFKVLWAKCEQLNATETLAFNQLYSTATQKVTTRFHRDVTPGPTWRFKWGSRYLHVFSIDNVANLNHTHVFICGEEVSA